ncbi:Mov34/MPN/PAD-1 family protein [Candidatus Magnetobacterium bavaricum]|uniref:Mov34/MPN/PAD-1 family protein n=1 Tax=Candidatus Magnetobacterium bavaricum TaxID=29290 RepID=A0A0F3H124_9BACT|nr:Mov34/MPN/PAD-1 family protein [Candidatus Magnetobacterium bavaricum]
MKLNKETLQFIYNHATKTYPDECCGIITGKADQQVAHACQNIQDILHQQDPLRYPRTARIAYTIDPKEADCIISQALQNGQDVMAFYHSHPDHDAYFSEEDVAAQTVFGEPQWPKAIQIVISVKLSMVNDLKCYKWDDSTQNFKENNNCKD